MRLLAALTLATAAAALAAPEPARALDGCTFNGLDLWGEVTLVDEDPDITVEVVTSGADLRVQWVDTYAGACGQWRRVGLGADFRVKVVPGGGDIRIQEVESGPGLP